MQGSSSHAACEIAVAPPTRTTPSSATGWWPTRCTSWGTRPARAAARRWPAIDRTSAARTRFASSSTSRHRPDDAGHREVVAGEPDGALACVEENVRDASPSGHALTLCNALIKICTAGRAAVRPHRPGAALRRDAPAAHERAPVFMWHPGRRSMRHWCHQGGPTRGARRARGAGRPLPADLGPVRCWHWQMRSAALSNRA